MYFQFMLNGSALVDVCLNIVYFISKEQRNFPRIKFTNMLLHHLLAMKNLQNYINDFQPILI